MYTPVTKDSSLELSIWQEELRFIERTARERLPEKEYLEGVCFYQSFPDKSRCSKRGICSLGAKQ